jgi:hypothetical protein
MIQHVDRDEFLQQSYTCTICWFDGFLSDFVALVKFSMLLLESEKDFALLIIQVSALSCFWYLSESRAQEPICCSASNIRVYIMIYSKC